MIKREEILTPEIVASVRLHALEAFPNEALGIVTKNGYRRLKNVSEHPTSTAMPDDGEWSEIAANKEAIALFHSHPNGLFAPSASDMKSQERLAIPFLLAATNGEAVTPVAIWGDQLEPLPLLERPFHHGITDCYEYIRDWHRIHRDRILPQFARDWSWWAKGRNLYEDGFPKARFHRIASAEALEGDVVLFKVRSDVYNHGGIVESSGIIGHHASSREAYDPTKLSNREPIARWMNHNPMFLRHEDD